MAYAYLTPYRGGGLTTGASGGARGGGSIFDLHRQMNRMFDDLLSGSETGSNGSGITGWPSLDIRQTEDEIEVCAELAGVNRDDISIDVDEGVLTISGEKKSSREDNGYSERTYGRFERRVSLPANVDEDKIEADLEEGLLTITLPLKEERSRGRRIELGSRKSKDRNNAEGQLIEGKSKSSDKESSGKKAGKREPQNA